MDKLVLNGKPLSEVVTTHMEIRKSGKARKSRKRSTKLKLFKPADSYIQVGDTPSKLWEDISELPKASVVTWVPSAGCRISDSCVPYRFRQYKDSRHTNDVVNDFCKFAKTICSDYCIVTGGNKQPEGTVSLENTIDAISKLYEAGKAKYTVSLRYLIMRAGLFSYSYPAIKAMAASSDDENMDFILRHAGRQSKLRKFVVAINKLRDGEFNSSITRMRAHQNCLSLFKINNVSVSSVAGLKREDYNGNPKEVDTTGMDKKIIEVDTALCELLERIPLIKIIDESVYKQCDWKQAIKNLCEIELNRKLEV